MSNLIKTNKRPINLRKVLEHFSMSNKTQSLSAQLKTFVT